MTSAPDLSFMMQRMQQGGVQPAGNSSPGPPVPTMLGQQADQAPPQQTPQQPDQQQQPDALDSLKNTFVQQYQANTPKPPSGGPIRSLLQNFFSGMGQSMLHEAGLPTQYDKQQAAMRGIEGVTAAQSQLETHKLLMQNMTRVPTSPELEQFGIPSGTMMTPAEQVKAMTQYNQARTAAQAKLGVAQVGAGAKVDVARINQGGGLQLPVDKTTAQLVGEPELEGKTLGAGGWKMLNAALAAKGYKIQDMATDGPQGGMWVIDRGGNRISQVSDKSIARARGLSFAEARAQNTPFDTIDPGTNTPTTISQAEALRTGAPHITTAQAASLGTKYAQFNDAYGILDNIDELAGKVDLSDAGARARVTAGYAALKDPQTTGMVSRMAGPMASEFLSNFLGRQPINASLKPDERDLVLAMAQGKAAATGLRGILGQAGTNEMQQRLDAGLFPGGQSVANSDTIRQQTKATRGLLDRFVVGQPQAGLNAPGTPTALANRTGGSNAPQNAPAMRFTEGSDVYDIPADKVERFKQLHPQAVPSGR